MTSQSSRDRILWISFFAGPAFWLFSFQAKFSWTQWACASQNKATLFVFAFLALLCSGTAGLLAWRQWKELGPEQPDEAANVTSRSRFMALGAVVFSTAFCVVILAQTIPDIILEACQ